MAEGYSTSDRYRAQQQIKERVKRCEGAVKWIGGQPTIHYVKSGYAWVNGDYVKVDPRATGITQTFSYSRAQERGARHQREHPGKGRPKREGQRPMSARAKSKRAAREHFERVKPIHAARLKALKADTQAARLARQARQAVSY